MRCPPLSSGSSHVQSTISGRRGVPVKRRGRTRRGIGGRRGWHHVCYRRCAGLVGIRLNPLRVARPHLKEIRRAVGERIAGVGRQRPGDRRLPARAECLPAARHCTMYCVIVNPPVSGSSQSRSTSPSPAVARNASVAPPPGTVPCGVAEPTADGGDVPCALTASTCASIAVPLVSPVST